MFFSQLLTRETRMNIKKISRKRIPHREIRSKGDSLSEKIVLAIIVAVFSILGSFLATYISKNIEENVWVRDTTYEYMTTILFKRVEIYDRATKVVAQRGMARAFSETIDMFPTLALPDFGKVSSYELRKELIGYRTSLDEINVEFISTMTLASTYFGPDTKAAYKNIQETHNPDWWNADDEQFRILLTAMNNELVYGFESMNLNKFIESLPSNP